jgi:lipoprotein-releasing system permease protein
LIKTSCNVTINFLFHPFEDWFRGFELNARKNPQFRTLMLALTIAFRYLIALRKASTVQILTVLSFVGILLGSMAMLVVLSAFNGFETLLRDIYHFQDPDLKITSKRQKTFFLDSIQLKKISEIPGIGRAFELVSDKAAIRYGDGQMVVEVVGIPDEFLKFCRMDTLLYEGKYAFEPHSDAKSLVSIGVKQSLNINLNSPFEYIQLLYPKQKKLLQLGTNKIFNSLNVKPSGIIRMDENRVYIPLQDARIFMDKPNGATQVQIFVLDQAELASIKSSVKKILGDDFLVLDENEQHGDLFRVMKIERLFVLLALGFIILISCFNLFVSCSMLVIDKQKDIRIFSAMGMPPSQIRQLVMQTGGLISLFGLLGGLAFGWAICWLQQEFGFVPLGMSTTLIRAYPVDIQAFDFLIVSLWVVLAGYLALIYPGKMAVHFSKRFQQV